jgi:predicted RNA methylase
VACVAAQRRSLLSPHPQVDALAALVARVAREVAADAVLDVGAGQGFLAQARRAGASAVLAAAS